MAMQILQVINNAHEDSIVAIAYDNTRKEIYTASEGDRLIKVWDQKTGELMRSQQGHRGWVTSLVYATNVKLLFSGSVDGNIGAWSDKGGLLQMLPAPGGKVFSLAWEHKQKILVVGGKSILTIFRVDLADALKVRQARRAAQHDVGPNGVRDAGALPDGATILKKVVPPLKGPELAHTDVVKAIVVTESGKIITGGFDRCLCYYDLEKPKESFRRVKKVHAAGVNSMAYDPILNVILTGSIDGGFKVWSMEGRCLDKFDGVADSLASVTHVPSTNTYWITGRHDRLVAFDPRAPANVSQSVADPNSLHDFPVNILYSPPDTDLVIGGTHTRSIVVWQYNPFGSHRVFEEHEDWVEGLVVVSQSMGDEVYSAGADGKLLRWRLDAEQNCDIYVCMEELQQHDGTIHAIIYHPDVDAIITGGDDTVIQLHPLSPQNRPNEGHFPTSLTEHSARVTALAALPGGLLVSASADRTLRTWDLNTMKLLSTMPLQEAAATCLEYSQERQQLAACGAGRRAKIWDLSNPLQPQLKVILDHHDPSASDDEEEDRPGGKNNMVWLTTSKLDNAAARAPNDMVREAIAGAREDVPEVTQVRWVPFKQCWVTAAEDEVIRMWSPEGELLGSFRHECGSVQCLFVDSVNALLLLASMDKTITAFSVNDPAPLAKYVGHKDVVKAIGYLSDQNRYVTGSWDRSLRLWQPPSTATSSTPARTGPRGVEEYGMGDDSPGNTWVSSYERAHPLTVPKALMQDNAIQVMELFGMLGEDGQEGGGHAKPKKGRRGAAAGGNDRGDGDGLDYEHPASLAARLSELNRQLLSELNLTSSAVEGGGATGGSYRLSNKVARADA